MDGTYCYSFNNQSTFNIILRTNCSMHLKKVWVKATFLSKSKKEKLYEKITEIGTRDTYINSTKDWVKDLKKDNVLKIIPS